MTRLIRSFYNVTKAMWGGVVTLGNFDGVHRGHQALIETVIKKARQEKRPSIVITFEPHPFEFFAQENVIIPRLTRLREKYLALAACGVDYVIVLPFNQIVASQSASDFVALLSQTVKPARLIIGDDFHFGHRRQGDIKLLDALSHVYHFTVEALPTFGVDGERVSSTRVRAALMSGDLALAKQLLGHSYVMMGRIRGGDQLGRQLGFPTANIHLHRKLTPITGIYIVLVHGLGDKPLPGAADVGIRPTVDGTRTLLEVHLLDFNEEIYGRYVTVEFCKRLRDEIRYPNIECLKIQMAKDVQDARDYFKQQGVL